MDGKKKKENEKNDFISRMDHTTVWVGSLPFLLNRDYSKSL